MFFFVLEPVEGLEASQTSPVPLDGPGMFLGHCVLVRDCVWSSGGADAAHWGRAGRHAVGCSAPSDEILENILKRLFLDSDRLLCDYYHKNTCQACPLTSRIINTPTIPFKTWILEYPCFEAQNPKDNCNAWRILLKGLLWGLGED